MPAIINPTITDAGLAAAVAADAGGIQVSITHVALGAGAYAPTGSETAMVDRREKVTLADGTVFGGVLHVNAMFPALGGAPYTASEIGFYIGDPDAGGTLFSVYSTTATEGIVLRTSLEFVAQFTLGLTRVPAGSVTVNIDPAAAFLYAMLQGHREEVDAHPEMLQAHLDAPDPHDQYLQKFQLAGAVMYFARTAPPAGWLKANGATVSRALYPELFAAIGTVFGAGDGATTFGLPDLRGEFLRGLDEARGVDPDRVLGSSQASAAPNITGQVRGSVEEAGSSAAGAFDLLKTNTTGASTGGQSWGFTFDASRSSPVYQDVAEVRPRSVAMLACIKT